MKRNWKKGGFEAGSKFWVSRSGVQLFETARIEQTTEDSVVAGVAAATTLLLLMIFQ